MRPDSGVPLPWDREVSRLHAQLERVDADWTLRDDGLSRNGTFVNGERLHGERALHDGDTIRLGTTRLTYRIPGERTDRETRPAADARVAEALTRTQRAVLIALCRPYREGSPFALHWTPSAVGSLLYLALAGSVAATWLNYWLLERMSATALLSMALVEPLIAVLLGAALLQEKVTIRAGLGGLLVLCSIFMITIAFPRSRS